ncbi:hypothetical protein EIK77_010493 [Talaromyces pinophilus]|nr:hypothetical protein EIK77_010493 [Talaromyces pinophilus]
MPPKGAKPTNDELLAQFDDLGIDTTGKPSEPTPAPPSTASSKPASTEPPTATEKDPLAELENLASQRPSTPRLSAEARRSKPSSGRTSEEKPATQPRAAVVEDEKPPEKAAPAPVAAQEETKSSGGGWWGGFLSTATATATAAMKQAEAAVKEIQKNEEAQKWAEQVRGNVGALRGLGTLPLMIEYVYTFKDQDN